MRTIQEKQRERNEIYQKLKKKFERFDDDLQIGWAEQLLGEKKFNELLDEFVMENYKQQFRMYFEGLKFGRKTIADLYAEKYLEE